MKNKFLRIEVSILIAVILCVLGNITAFSQECDSIRSKMLRMHVVANSDSSDDQELKLKVRDAVLEKGKELFDGSLTAENAQKMLIPHIAELEAAAVSVIEKEGYDYSVRITIQKEYFSTRTYDNSVTLPAGEYMAVKVIIGEGKGQNWWCVMFPPMCLPSASAECELSDVLSEDEEEIVTDQSKYHFQFKLVELYEEFIKPLYKP